MVIPKATASVAAAAARKALAAAESSEAKTPSAKASLASFMFSRSSTVAMVEATGPVS